MNNQKFSNQLFRLPLNRFFKETYYTSETRAATGYPLYQSVSLNLFRGLGEPVGFTAIEKDATRWLPKDKRSFFSKEFLVNGRENFFVWVFGKT